MSPPVLIAVLRTYPPTYALIYISTVLITLILLVRVALTKTNAGVSVKTTWEAASKRLLQAAHRVLSFVDYAKTRCWRKSINRKFTMEFEKNFTSLHHTNALQISITTSFHINTSATACIYNKLQLRHDQQKIYFFQCELYKNLQEWQLITSDSQNGHHFTGSARMQMILTKLILVRF